MEVTREEDEAMMPTKSLFERIVTQSGFVQLSQVEGPYGDDLCNNHDDVTAASSWAVSPEPDSPLAPRRVMARRYSIGSNDRTGSAHGRVDPSPITAKGRGPSPLDLDGYSSSSRRSGASSSTSNTYRPRPRGRPPICEHDRQKTDQTLVRSQAQSTFEKRRRALEANRRAAAKCRNRQRAYVEDLQDRASREQQRMLQQKEAVRSLQEEILALRNEILRHGFCGCGLFEQAVGMRKNRSKGGRVGFS